RGTMAGKSVTRSQSSVISRKPSVASSEASPEYPPATSKSRPAAAEPTATRLDRLIHERLRLAIVSALAVNERLTFNDLKHLLQTTDGNLSVHARQRREGTYI